MRRALAVLPAGSWPLAQVVGSVTLPAAGRHRRRIRLTDDEGAEFLLDLPNAVQMRDGDGLALEAGGVIRVTAALEEVADVVCSDPQALARLAWHIGNRHVPVQLMGEGRLRVPADHVLLTMLEGLGVTVRCLRAPFQPEAGAYDPHGLAESPPPLVRRA